MALNSTCAVICCSNGIKRSETENITLLENSLKKIFSDVREGEYIFSGNDTVSPAAAKTRAGILTELFRCGVSNIFDISGGDICNEILPYINQRACFGDTVTLPHLSMPYIQKQENQVYYIK